MENLNLGWVIIGLIAALVVIGLMLFIAYGPLSKRNRPTTDAVRLPDELQGLTQTQVSLVSTSEANTARVLVLEGHMDLTPAADSAPDASSLQSAVFTSSILWQWQQEASGPYNQVQMQVAHAEVQRVMIEAFVNAGWLVAGRNQLTTSGDDITIQWVLLSRENP